MTLSTLGIDIAKLKFDVALRTTGDKFLHQSFPNTPDGFARLAAWLARRAAGRVHACLEATGTYGEALARYLHDTGHTVSVVNPAAIKAFAASRLSRTKTDRVDAELIARYCHTQHPPAWAPPAAEILELQALGRRLEALVEMRTMERNRLAAGVTSEAVRGSLEQHLAYLDAEIGRTQKLIGTHIDAHPGLREQRDLLVTIPGIGEATAAPLLAEMPEIKTYHSARQAAAFAGLAPRRRESGSSVRGRARLSKIGSSRLRRALYFPAGCCTSPKAVTVSSSP
ncbi:MAG: IS110 family transposase [Acidobacteriota bacterium]|nr:IS110 family transposase [Acidobacteriota bacterium]